MPEGYLVAHKYTPLVYSAYFRRVDTTAYAEEGPNHNNLQNDFRNRKSNTTAYYQEALVWTLQICHFL